MCRFDYAAFTTQNTNSATQVQWSDRPVRGNDPALGVPLEDMIELANTLGADPWFNIPHTASDDWITQFATLVKTTLRPDVTVYIEWSNEVWNSLFAQYAYSAAKGAALGKPACIFLLAS